MRLNLTSIKENKRVLEISRIIDEAFRNTDFKVTIVECNYEKNREKILAHHKQYYLDNYDKIKQYHINYNKKKKAKKLAEKQEKEKNNTESKMNTTLKQNTNNNINEKSELKTDTKAVIIESDLKNTTVVNSKTAIKSKNTTEQKTDDKHMKKNV